MKEFGLNVINEGRTIISFAVVELAIGTIDSAILIDLVGFAFNPRINIGSSSIEYDWKYCGIL